MSEKGIGAKDLSEIDRAELRSALIAYMKEHDIGVPTLQVRIAKATGRSDPRYVPLKTLQRFLSNATRTNDAMVTACSQFIEIVKPKAKADVLSEALAVFFEVPQTGIDQKLAAGCWVSESAEVKVSESALGLLANLPEPVAISALTIETGTNAQGFKVSEQVTNPIGTASATYDPGFRHAYSGTALPFSSLLCIILRNDLTGLPRNYWLTVTDIYMHGHGTEAVYAAGGVMSELAQFMFRREGAQEPAQW